MRTEPGRCRITAGGSPDARLTRPDAPHVAAFRDVEELRFSEKGSLGTSVTDDDVERDRPKPFL